MAVGLFPALALAGCASHAPAGAPDLTPVAGAPAPPHAKLYADCIAQAAASGAFDRNADRDSDWIRFTCTGEPARAFFDALAARSARIGSQWTAGGRTWRSTNKVQHDLNGVDYCSAAPSGEAECVVVLNVGSFLHE